MIDNTQRLEKIYNLLGGEKPFNELNQSEIEKIKTISYFASMCENFDLFVEKDNNNDGN